MKGCQLPEFKRCCCTCQFHVVDYHHCTIHRAVRAEKGKCVCSEPKGFICLAPELNQAFSEWPEHGLCEMHQTKEPENEIPT